MANGFQYVNNDNDTMVAKRHIQAKASTQFVAGGLLEIALGVLLPLNAAADKAFGVFDSLSVPAAVPRPTTKRLSTTAGEVVGMIPCLDNDAIFQTDMSGTDAPIMQNLAVISGTTTTVVIADTTSGTTGDFNGGCILVNGEQRNIVTSVLAAGNFTITVDRAFTTAPVAGDKYTACYFNAGMKNVKLAATNPDQGVSRALADLSGGYVEIYKVILSHTDAKVQVKFRSA